MNQLTEKLKKIYLPFLLIAIGFIAVYTFLDWLLFIKIGISVKEDILKFWLPASLPWIPILIWLRPRIHLLSIKKDNGHFGFQAIATIAIIATTMVAQSYLFTATGKLTELDNIDQISQFEKSKYYTVKEYYIDKQHISGQNTVTVTGKHNENLNMDIYVVMPILQNAADTLNAKNTGYWLGKKYHDQISNRLSDQEKEDEYENFATRSQREFEETNFFQFIYLERVGNTDDGDEYNNALKKIGHSPANDIVFEAKTEPFEARNGEKLPWIFISFGIGAFLFFIFLLFPKLDEKNLKNFKKGKKDKNTGFILALSFFIPRKDYFITPILIDLNVLIFIIMVFAGLGFVSFKADDLLVWGANYKPLTENGQWWRLLTSIFLHGGIMHIFANMYGLLFVGIFLEPLLGKTKYILIYLITGILASVASIWWHDATVSVGASGAIFGLYGFFLACLLLKVFPRNFSRAFLISTLIFIGFNLLAGLSGGIDNAAHIGGLVSGFIFGLVMSNQLKEESEDEEDKTKY